MDSSLDNLSAIMNTSCSTFVSIAGINEVSILENAGNISQEVPAEKSCLELLTYTIWSIHLLLWKKIKEN